MKKNSSLLLPMRISNESYRLVTKPPSSLVHEQHDLEAHLT